MNDIQGCVQVIPGKCKSDIPFNLTGVDKIHLKCDCIEGFSVNDVRETILDSFALSAPPGHKLYKEPTINFFKRINKSVLSHMTFYLEDNDHKAVVFNGQTINFTRQLIKM